MREILFRGKSNGDGEWITGFLVSPSHIGDWVNAHPIDPKTVGQFTGLTDKNGTKIFEGDIVKTKYGRLCIVVWFSSQAHNGWDLQPVATVDNCVYTRGPDGSDLYKKNNLEVLGNIHDNPELLTREAAHAPADQ